MIIQCETCSTKFNIDDDLIHSNGSRVRCSRCKEIFVAYPKEQIQTEEKTTGAVTNGSPDFIEEAFGAEDEEEWDMDDGLEEDAMEDFGALEATYGEDLFDHMEINDDAIHEVSEEDLQREIMAHLGLDKKKTSKASFFLISILIVLGLLGAAYYALTKWAPQFIPKPLMSQKTETSEKPPMVDAGASRLRILSVDGSFVASETSGRLFAVRGKIMNEYSTIRRFLRVKANILDDTGRIVKEKYAYAGNPFKNKELPTLTMEEIDRHMKNRLGIDNINTNVEAGQHIDFAVVFGNLPENVSHFEVEPVSSSQNNPEAGDQP